MSNSGVTTESGGRQNMFPTETRPYIDESASYEGYPQNAEKVNGRWAMVGFVALIGAYVTTGQIIPGIFQDKFINFLSLKQILIYFNFENKKNQINVIVLRLNIIPRKMYANFLPINAVSGSSLTLIKSSIYLN